MTGTFGGRFPLPTLILPGLLAGVCALHAQPPDYSRPAPVVSLFKPYLWHPIQGPDFANGKDIPLVVEDGKLRLSMALTAAFMTPIAAIIIWLGVKPYGRAIAEIKVREAAGQA